MNKLLFTNLFLILFLFSCAEPRPDKFLEENSQRVEKTLISSGEYFFKETVTTTDLLTNSMSGIVGSSRVVKFEFSEDYLTIYESTARSNSIIKASSENLVTARPISRFRVKHVDVRRSRDGNGDSTNEFVETTEDHKWDKRKYVVLDLSSEEILDRTVFSDRYGIYQDDTFKDLAPAGEIKDIEISKDIINFTSLKSYSGGDRKELLDVRYSFMPVRESSYISRTYTEEEQTRVGFFKTQVAKYNDLYQRETVDYLNRFNPDKNITFYLSTNWNDPQYIKYKKYAYDAIKEWNRVFKDVLGRDNFITLKESDGTQKIGDLRFNMIHLAPYSMSSQPLGYGPHMVNPNTGEIINSNVMIYLDAMKKDIGWIVKKSNYLTEQKKNGDNLLTSNSSMSNQLQQLPVDFRESEQALNDYFNFADTYRRLNTEQLVDRLGLHKTLLKKIISEHSNHHHGSGICQLQKRGQDFYEGIDSLIADGKTADNIIEMELNTTLLHELGHAFGLRHNFKGSVDANNFYYDQNEKGEIAQRSSSIMDYNGDIEHNLIKLGKYDIAAIRYGYSKVKSEIANFDYLYCTDEHVHTDPMCNRFDVGISPDQVAANIALKYEKNYKIRNLKNDLYKIQNSPGLSYSYMNSLMMQYFVPLRSFIDYKAKHKLDEAVWDKAEEIAYNFFMSALFNAHEDETQMGPLGEVSQIGTRVDRKLAIDFLTMQSLGEIGLSYYNVQSHFTDIGEDKSDIFKNGYLSAIFGISRPYDIMNGVMADSENYIFLKNDIRYIALYNLLFSNMPNMNYSRVFHVDVFQIPHSADILYKQDNFLKRKFEVLRSKFKYIPDERDIISDLDLVGLEDDFIKYNNNPNIVDAQKDEIAIFLKLIDSLKIYQSKFSAGEVISEVIKNKIYKNIVTLKEHKFKSAQYLNLPISFSEYEEKIFKLNETEYLKYSESYNLFKEYNDVLKGRSARLEKAGLEIDSNYIIDYASMKVISVPEGIGSAYGEINLANELISTIKSYRKDIVTFNLELKELALEDQLDSKKGQELQFYKSFYQKMISDQFIFLYRLNDLYKQYAPGNK